MKRKRTVGEGDDLNTLNNNIKTVKAEHERSINRIHKLVKGHGDEPDEKNKSDIHNEIKFHLAVVKSTHQKMNEAETLSLHLEPVKTASEFLEKLKRHKMRIDNRLQAVNDVEKNINETIKDPSLMMNDKSQNSSLDTTKKQKKLVTKDKIPNNFKVMKKNPTLNQEKFSLIEEQINEAVKGVNIKFEVSDVADNKTLRAKSTPTAKIDINKNNPSLS